MSLVYVKIAAQNYGELVFDTNDLSTIRGSSLTLLAATDAVYSHLENTFSDRFRFERIVSAASELVFRWTSLEEVEQVTIEPRSLDANWLKNWTAGPKKQLVRKVVKAQSQHIGEIVSDDRLREAADKVFDTLKVTDVADRAARRDVIASALLHHRTLGKQPQSTGPSDQITEIEQAARAFLSKPCAFDGAEWPLDLFSFAIASEVAAPNRKIADIFDALNTRLARTQLQQLTCALPPRTAVGGNLPADKVICAYNRKLASGPTSEWERKDPTSPSVHRRRKVGTAEKQKFYDRTLSRALDIYDRLDKSGAMSDFVPGMSAQLAEMKTRIEKARALLKDGSVLKFANDFDDIVRRPKPDQDTDQDQDRAQVTNSGARKVQNAAQRDSKSVQGNMCVLYMDGNRFNSRMQALLQESKDKQQGKNKKGTDKGQNPEKDEEKDEGIERYRLFSDVLEVMKAALLADCLQWIEETPGLVWRTVANGPDPEAARGIARFETLLWGGEEFCFVVPAFAGWDLAKRLQKSTSTWQNPLKNNGNGNGKGGGGEPDKLHFATGLVFADFKAPIAQFRDVAENLCDCAKHDREKSNVQMLAFESVDRIHFSPNHYRADWLAIAEPGKAAEAFSLDGADLESFEQRLQDLLSVVGRAALHRWRFRFSDLLGKPGADPKVQAALKAIEEDINRRDTDFKLDHLISGFIGDKTLIGGEDYPLLQLAHSALLLDYILPPDETAQ